ncbi:uncharacterized protein LOC133157011 [Syngnathus typhle]|uniref:uncharacterized protein LOC133157011 n=1 Tax=Syngnathus typhle TaxID=161592 RepID=UPI002A6B327A|nr:uncharacterized protein LOC133157011 [Syngnathus typhle]
MHRRRKRKITTVARRFITMTSVFFDLATTGLNSKVCDIVQIGAVCDEQTFNTYIVPDCCISRGASGVTGFYVANGLLFRYGEAMPTVSLHWALTSFIDFLASFQEPVYLVAHNASRFDVHVLSRILAEFSLLQKFRSVVACYVDTLLISRRMVPHSRNHKFHDLVWRHLGKGYDYDAYNPLEQAEVLQDLYNVWNPSWDTILDSMIYP